MGKVIAGALGGVIVCVGLWFGYGMYARHNQQHTEATFIRDYISVLVARGVLPSPQTLSTPPKK